jgi:pimeloyl-ACP methyl ester carboxylesterase
MASPTMSEEIRPFKIDVTESDLEDLRRRLRATRWPDRQTVPDWSQGIPLQYVQEVCDYWARDYDWRRTEARLNALPQFQTCLDGVGIYFLHVRSPHADATPLILTHGWPGSVIEFLKVIPALTDPCQRGGESQDAFHLVCPALPGFGFSDQPRLNGWSVQRIARAWSELMLRLGYQGYYAQGGDWGADVTTAIALQDKEHCCGIHLNMPVGRPDPATMDNLTDEEKDCLAGMRHYRDWDSGYSKQQSTRPQTLGYALADSPAGQAAWILEKFWAWTDCRGNPENVLTRDEMLDNIMLYWLPNAAASSARLYWESFGKLSHGPYDPVQIPAGCSIFPKDILRLSRRWAEKRYRNLLYWNRVDRGGHFAAFEQPDLFVSELRACFRALRAR